MKKIIRKANWSSGLRFMLVLLTALVIKGTAEAATYTVINTNDSGAGSLRQAIADAAPGDTITFDTAGVFATPQTVTLTSGELVINKSLTVQGPGASQLAVSGNNASRVFFIEPGNTVRELTRFRGQVSINRNGVRPKRSGWLSACFLR